MCWPGYQPFTSQPLVLPIISTEIASHDTIRPKPQTTAAQLSQWIIVNVTVTNDVVWVRWQMSIPIVCKYLWSQSFELQGREKSGMVLLNHKHRNCKPWHQKTQIIFAQLPQSQWIIVNVTNDVVWVRWQYLVCKYLWSLSFELQGMEQSNQIHTVCSIIYFSWSLSILLNFLNLICETYITVHITVHTNMFVFAWVSG